MSNIIRIRKYQNHSLLNRLRSPWFTPLQLFAALQLVIIVALLLRK